MPMNWNGDANCKLLLSILKTQDVKVDCAAVAKELTTDTVTCTTRAVEEQLKKLKKAAKEDATKEDGAKSPVSTSAKSKKRAAGDADGGPPTKKGRKSPVKAKAKAIIKPEPAVEDEAQDDDAAME